MPVLFTYAFRPLFLLATLYAVVVVPYWAAAWLGAHSVPTQLGNPIAWHAHEMIFGFAGAAIGGFALTAVATWTTRPPVSGAPLVALSAAWLLARVLLLLPIPSLLPVAVAADLSYGTLLFALMAREVLLARNKRNYKVLLLLALLVATNALFFVGVFGDAGWIMASLLAGMWLVVWLINLVGGRIIPGFTRNWLKRQVTAEQRQPNALPPPFDRFDMLTTGLLLLFGALHTAGAPAEWTAVLGVLTGLLLFVRLRRWQGLRTLSEPLVWVLHVAFAWIPIGVLLLSAAELDLAPRTAGVHALTNGAIATMVVAVASRAALGHTGRPLRSHPLLTAAYGCISASAVLRVAAAFGPGARILLMASATAWTLGFVCFAWRYAPILTRPKELRPGSLPVV
jgi:uncharacterized protein involved in response to NO